jgi:glycosyltransferase involved in cell wall biosynthesis
MEPRVSTVVPVYNGARWLRSTVESLASQTHPNHEIVLVNDGSTDRSGALIDELARAENIIAVHQSNAGVAAARNKGIRCASGDLIAFCDQDDLWLSNKLEAQLPLFSSEIGLVFSGVEFRYPERSRQAVPKGPPPTFQSMLLSNSICSCTAIVRRSELEQVGLLDPDRALMGVDDWHLWLRLLTVTRAAYAPEVLAVHVVHGDNYSSQERAMLDASLACLDAIETDESLSKGEADLCNARISVYRHYAQNFIFYSEFDEARRCLRELYRLQPTPGSFIPTDVLSPPFPTPYSAACSS